MAGGDDMGNIIRSDRAAPRTRGFEVLVRSLGRVNAVRFIQQYEPSRRNDTHRARRHPPRLERRRNGAKAEAGRQRSRFLTHVTVTYGHNDHHIAEALCKPLGKSPRMTTECDPREAGVPSTKGIL
jgi:hypothetical protein